MEKIQVVYLSMTGNTQAMAEAIGEGVVAAGKACEVIEVSQASVETLKNATCFALGCPAMGDEVLEEEEMEPFVTELEPHVAGKHIALFGSYSWRDGEWMRNWVARMQAAGAVLVSGDGLMCYDAPDEDMIEKCRNLGKELTKAS